MLREGGSGRVRVMLGMLANSCWRLAMLAEGCPGDARAGASEGARVPGHLQTHGGAGEA